MTPIRLTDTQLHELLQAAQMVPFDLGDSFLERVAGELRGRGKLGHGLVHRTYLFPILWRVTGSGPTKTG